MIMCSMCSISNVQPYVQLNTKYKPEHQMLQHGKKVFPSQDQEGLGSVNSVFLKKAVLFLPVLISTAFRTRIFLLKH